MNFKDQCLERIKEITKIEQPKKGKKDGHSPYGAWRYNSDGDFCLFGNAPVANCVQANTNSPAEHWIWLSLHAALFRDLGD